SWRASAATAGCTATRCRPAGRFSSASASCRSRRRRRSSFLAQLVERGPARVDSLLHVLVRLGIQILAADRAEAGAIVAAEDLVGQCERDRVAGPGGEVEAVVLQILGPIVVTLRSGRLILAQAEGERQLRVREAAEARAGERDVERQLEHGAARRAG